ncbi:MAG: Crp/Fnr family transcriptional regulator [Lachnospiraceae bacterium]|nr:Crp/Fnr family transcriptional regulator [Lachnospiraceae bacterium]
MDKEYLNNQLMNMAKQNGMEMDAEILGVIVNNSVFRVVPKGNILQSVGEKTKTAALVLDGICRCYYVDGDGNDLTRGFSVTGTFCMEEGLFGYSESIVTWETLEETTLMFFDVQKMKELIFENNQLKNAYIMFLENALRYKIYRENGFLVENATERYIHFKKLYPTICDSVKQHYVATYLGIAPESLSRIKKALKENQIAV